MTRRLRSCRPALQAAFCALLAITTPAFAAWTNEPTINTTVCAASAEQGAPRAVADGNGGAFITWHDLRNGSYDIYAQHLDARGNATWTADGVGVCTASLTQDFPVLCPDGAGGIYVVWRDTRNGNSDIYAQRLDGNGVPQWTANGVPVVTVANTQDSPVIKEDGVGGAYVVWRDFRNGNMDLYAQRLQSNGTLTWPATGFDIAVTTGSQYSPLLAVDAFGSAIVTWADDRNGTIDVYAQRFGPFASVFWAANGIALCTAADTQSPTAIVSDGTSNVYVAWTDLRNNATSNWDIYLQAIRYSGSVLWTANGVPVCTNSAQQREPTLVVDPAGGVFVAWNDTRTPTRNELWGQRLTGGGAALWAADGIQLVTNVLYRESPTGFPDGEGGFVLVWNDSRGSAALYDLVAQRYNSSGAQQWTTGGVPLMANAVTVNAWSAVSDGAGGAIAVDAENRSSAGDLFAQRVDRYGYLGNTAPRITAVKDVPGDQGGQVKLSFEASYLEDAPWYAVSSYRVFRSVSPQAAAARTVPARLTRDAEEAIADPDRVLYVTGTAAASYSWEYLTTVAVDYLGNYSVLAATAYDSTSLGNPRTAFMVQGRAGTKHWESDPDSAYSVDNLAPATPQPFAAAYSAGAVALHWGANSEVDVDHYRLWRGSDPGFVPGPATFLADVADTQHVDATGGPYWYRVAAVDVHGNVGGTALAFPSGSTAVPDAGPASLALAAPSPNPLREAGLVRWSLSRAGAVRLTVLDVAGRRVRDLEHGTFDAGPHATPWDGRDDAGRVLSAGLYVVVLEAEGRTLRTRAVVTR